MKIGLIARADRTGLAVQTWEFWRNMQPYKTLVINPTWIGHGQSLDSKYNTKPRKIQLIRNRESATPALTLPPLRGRE